MTALVWFRRDLRLDDNPAWAAATAAHRLVQAVFVADPRLWHAGGLRRRALLVGHLHALDRRLRQRGGRLAFHKGDPKAVLPRVSRASQVEAVYWNDDSSPYARSRDAAVTAGLEVPVGCFPGVWVHRPGLLLTGAGRPYRVFTPFYRRWQRHAWEMWPAPGDTRLGADSGDGLPAAAEPLPFPVGEAGARDRLDAFLDRVDRYDRERDRPDLDTTSRLSSDLKFGTISPRRIVTEVGDATPGRESFVRQVAWRDFYAQVLVDAPESVNQSLHPAYRSISWNDDRDQFTAWCEGRTGYPIVDAGMRQLLAEGWMHNRVRMITASFLVKDLLIDWRRGERHFRRLLIDGDIAQNVGNWQWVAGTGADAAPYFRVFNPVTQGRKFDPTGDYVRRFAPELAGLDTGRIHEPWSAGPLELAAAGVDLGRTYPHRMVDHAGGRVEAIEVYGAARRAWELRREAGAT